MVQTEHPHSFCRSVMIFVYALVASGLSLTSATQLVKPYFTPSCTLGQGGRCVWEGGEAPCLAAWCVTVGNAEAAVRHSVGASLTYADICCIVFVAASVSLSMWPRCHVGVAVVEQGV